jgi:hypothetical protein
MEEHELQVRAESVVASMVVRPLGYTHVDWHEPPLIVFDQPQPIWALHSPQLVNVWQCAAHGSAAIWMPLVASHERSIGTS